MPRDDKVDFSCFISLHIGYFWAAGWTKQSITLGWGHFPLGSLNVRKRKKTIQKWIDNDFADDFSAVKVLSLAAPFNTVWTSREEIVQKDQITNRSDSDIPLSFTQNLSLLTSVPMVMMMEHDSPNSCERTPLPPQCKWKTSALWGVHWPAGNWTRSYQQGITITGSSTLTFRIIYFGLRGSLDAWWQLPPV